MKFTSEKLRGFFNQNFLKGFGSVLDLSSREPIDPDDFVGFDHNEFKYSDYMDIYNDICQDMLTAWHIVLDSTSDSLPDDEQRKR